MSEPDFEKLGEELYQAWRKSGLGGVSSYYIAEHAFERGRAAGAAEELEAAKAWAEKKAGRTQKEPPMPSREPDFEEKLAVLSNFLLVLALVIGLATAWMW